MANINLPRVLLGGVAAGLIIICGELVLNGVVLADQWAEFRERHLIDTPGTAQYAVGGVLTLSYGIVLTWIYAAMLPRFGPGRGTAIIAGLTFWVIAYALFLLSVWANGAAPLYVAVVSILWGLVEAPVAALAGAWLYREREGPAAGRAPLHA
ncbi:MAG: hypothetical protein AAFX08_06970 [Pseudomonadota bacterium]